MSVELPVTVRSLKVTFVITRVPILTVANGSPINSISDKFAFNVNAPLRFTFCAPIILTEAAPIVLNGLVAVPVPFTVAVVFT